MQILYVIIMKAKKKFFVAILIAILFKNNIKQRTGKYHGSGIWQI